MSLPADNSWSQSHVNSISQIAPMYHNVVAQTSQPNFLQQQQQQQQQNNQQQPMQSPPYFCYPSNQQGTFQVNQYGQPYQQEAYNVVQPQQQQQQIPRAGLGNVSQPIGQTAYNLPSIMQSQPHGYGSLPAHILDQIRPYIGSPAPIFILPNNCPSPVVPPQAATPPSMTQGCPGLGINCPTSAIYCPPNSCYPYPVPLPFFNPYSQNQTQNNTPKESSKNCGCCSRKSSGPSDHQINSNFGHNDQDEHNCTSGNDDTVCSKRNCPSAINLQALASQLLAIQGIIPCAATRLVLRKVAGSNITSTMEETIERAKRSLNTLTRDQLLLETRHAQQVNALINLHMTANPPANVIPILTTIQLKVNLLKAHVDSAINRRLSESQGADGNGTLDPVILALKSDQELRDLLGTLRQKECEERVNLNFAPYQSQRVIAESRLANIQNKICQVETEMQRRRGAAIPTQSLIAQQFSDPGWYGYTGDVSNTSSSGGRPAETSQNYDSPDPFQIQVRSPKRLNVQPHVGSPETTYERPKKSTARSSRSRKDSDDEDCEENPKNSAREASPENHRCACEKSSEDDSCDEAKKKLGGKIIVEKDLASMREGEHQTHPGVSILKLSKNIVIVIDNACEGKKGKKDKDDTEKISEEKIKKEDKKEEKKEPKDSARSSEVKTHNSVGTVAHKKNDNDKTTVVEKIKKFTWGKKKEKIEDHGIDQVKIKQEPSEPKIELQPSEEKIELQPPEVKIEQEPQEVKIKAEPPKDEKKPFKSEFYFEVAQPVENVKRERDFLYESEGPEPVREQTVRMITKIDYEPSVFRPFRNSVDEPPEKETVIEERFKGSFTEDSLKSTSTESNVDSNRTPESISFRVEDLDETSISPVNDSDDVEHIVEASKIEVSQRISQTTTEEDKTEQENFQIKEKNVNFSKRKYRSGPSRHNDVNEESLFEVHHREVATPENKQEATDDDMISGALTTIGNHVASFGSLIGKIAALKLHQVTESSQMILAENSTKKANEVDSNFDENEAGSSATNYQGNSIKSDFETKEKIGKWKYIKFAEVDDTMSARSAGSSSDSETYALPKIKHSVIEDKSRGSKYVVIEQSSEELRRELGEPYRTGRSLVIRSRPKSPQSSSSSSEQSAPLTVVKGPNKRDKNCLALHFVSPKSTRKNRSIDTRDLKSSEKFWFRTETREEQNDQINEMQQYDENGINEICELETNDSLLNNEHDVADFVDKNRTAVAYSNTSVNEECLVELHKYSTISVT